MGKEVGKIRSVNVGLRSLSLVVSMFVWVAAIYGENF